MVQALDGAAARRWAELSTDALEVDRAAIDRINVYPVADNDTGTNMLQTMRSAVAALDGSADGELPGVLRALAKGALAGARGNSGMLLSQVLRGVAESVGDAPVLDGTGFARALEQATERARRAVAVPEAGTLLSVLDAGTEAASRAGPELTDVVREATTASMRALEATTAEQPALTAAGVVDAGGRGAVVLLDTLHAVVGDGRRLAADPPSEGVSATGADRTGTNPANSTGPVREYEVMYLLAGVTNDAAARLRDRLAALGDCVSVAGDGGFADDVESWAVHVHCDDIGAAIESGIELGRVHGIRVTPLVDASAARTPGQSPAERPADGAPTDGSAAPATERAVVACTWGDRVAELFRSEGARVLTLDADEQPGEDALLSVVLGTGAAHVLVLPNDEALTEQAERAASRARPEGVEVVVIPTASPVQGLAALAVHDADRRAVDDTVAMAEAAAATRRGELVVAERDALTWVGYCAAGDVLGLLDGEVVRIGRDPVTVSCELADRMLSAGGELVTALIGASAPESLADDLHRHLRRTHPEVELSCYPAGDCTAALLLGVE